MVFHEEVGSGREARENSTRYVEDIIQYTRGQYTGEVRGRSDGRVRCEGRTAPRTSFEPLFVFNGDGLTGEIRHKSPWTMMFAYDIAICSESREQVEDKQDRWIYALARRGMQVNRIKTEYMCVCVCVNERQDNGTVRIQGEEVAKVDDFK